MKKKAPRNKTISLTGKETAAYAARTVRLTKTAALSEVLDKTICQDALKALDLLPDACADLLIADPPYNLTKIFGKSTFKEMDFDAYKLWLDKWLAKTVRLLKDDASIYICADWKTSIAIPEIAGKYFILQNRISWEREKGRGALNNWKNCLEDIWFFTKSRNYKFNLDAVKVQRPVIAPYRDEAGRPKDWVDDGKGRYRLTAPSNVWTDISIPFWSMPENTPHPTQKTGKTDCQTHFGVQQCRRRRSRPVSRFGNNFRYGQETRAALHRHRTRKRICRHCRKTAGRRQCKP